MKSEGRNPKAEGNPKPEIRRRAQTHMVSWSLSFWASDFGFLPHANIRIRTLRRGLQSVRRQIHVAPAVVSHRVDQMPGLQETGPEGVFFVQFPTKNLDFRREESGVYGPETGQQRG